MQEKSGNIVTYDALPKKVNAFSRARVLIGLGLVFLAVVVVALTMGVHPGGIFLAALSGAGLVGINTVTYETPVAGTTAPTAAQSRTHQTIGATITGDNSAVAFTVTHNWGLSAAQLAKGFPEVNLEVILAAGYTAAAIITSKTANTVVFSNTAFTGAGLRVTLSRPFSMLQ